jgi:hypothetical protein
MRDPVEYRVEFTEDGWDESKPGWRKIDVVGYFDGVEVFRERCPEPAEYMPEELERRTSPETQSAMDELAGRAAATGRPVFVMTFITSGEAEVHDGEYRDGKLELVSAGRVPIPPSLPPKRVPRRWMPRIVGDRASASARPRATRTRSRPRERRARASSASRDGPSKPDDLDPPPRSRLARWLRRLLRRAA